MTKMRVYSVVCLLCLLLAGCGSWSQVAPENTDSDCQPTEAELTAMYAANALMQEWQEDRMACFGGAYREGERIVVLLTEDREEYRNEILKRTSFDNLILFETCDFSMNDLQALYDKVEKVVYEKEHGNILYSIDVAGNHVDIQLPEVTEELAAEWKALDTKGGGRAVEVSRRGTEEVPVK